MTLGSGCASGVDAIQWACAQIGAGRIVGALAGAADAPLATSVHAAWGKLGWLSRWSGPPAQALRPYDALSDGSVLGEGAGMYVLEDLDHSRARGARVYAEVLGYGSGSDGLDLRTVDPTGASLQAAMRGRARGRAPGAREIDHVNAHGGGVPRHDRAESAAYRAVLRPARVQHSGHVDQGDDRPAVRGGRRAPGGRRLLLPGGAVRSPDHEPRHPRPRVRPRLRAGRGRPGPGEPRHGHLARHRSHALGGHPRPPGTTTSAPAPS